MGRKKFMWEYEYSKGLAMLGDAWDAAGLPGDVGAPIREAMDKHAAVNAEWREIEASRLNVEADIARRVIDGETTIRGGLAELHDAELFDPAAGVGPRLLGAVRKLALVRAAEAVRVSGAGQTVDDSLVQVVEDARRLGPAVEGVADATDAMRRGGKVASAWADLVALETRRTALLAVRRALGMVDAIDPEDELPDFAGRTAFRIARMASAETVTANA